MLKCSLVEDTKFQYTIRKTCVIWVEKMYEEAIQEDSLLKEDDVKRMMDQLKDFAAEKMPHHA